MTLNISNYDGSTFITIPDQTLNTQASSIEFPGRGLQQYGTAINQDLLWIMQHFSRATQPDNPIRGQIWYDITGNVLKLYDGSSWVPSGSMVSGTTAPAAPVVGTLWWNTSASSLNIWSGTVWDLVSSARPALTVFTPTASTVVLDTTLNRTILAINNGATVFTPAVYSNCGDGFECWVVNTGTVNVSLQTNSAGGSPPMVPNNIVIAPGSGSKSIISASNMFFVGN